MTTPAVLILGATGFVGGHLTAQLVAQGHRVIALSRDAAGARRRLDKSVQVVDCLDVLPAGTAIDAVVNLAGAQVLGRPWTSARRQELISSRTGPAGAALDLMRRLDRPPRVLVAASAVGYYGATPKAGFEPRDESAPPRPGQFQSDLCVAVERAADAAVTLGVRVVKTRFAVVLGRGGGAYPMLMPSARFGFGAVLGSGRQPAPWVHLADAIGLIRLALSDESIVGPLNVVAPDLRSQARFEEALAASFGRKVRLRLPDAALRLVAGEMASLLLDGQNAVPRRALEAGYAFRFPGLEGALGNLAKTR